MTASFGIAELCADRPVTDSIGKADLAMYEAKRAGRNQVRVWGEPQPGPEVEADLAGFTGVTNRTGRK